MKEILNPIVLFPPLGFGVFLKFLEEALNPQNYCLLTDSLGLSFQIWIFFSVEK